MTFTAADKLGAVQRELKMRRRLYPKWIEAGRITDGFAAANIEIFEAIEADYVKAAESERLI